MQQKEAATSRRELKEAYDLGVGTVFKSSWHGPYGGAEHDDGPEVQVHRPAVDRRAGAVLLQGPLLLAGVAKGLPTATNIAEEVAIEISHTFRHVEKAGFDRAVVQDAIKQDLSKAAGSLSGGQYNGSVVVNGIKLDYSAFNLPDGNHQCRTNHSPKAVVKHVCCVTTKKHC